MQSLLNKAFFYNLWSTLYCKHASKAIANIILQKKNARVLDLACGTGRLRKGLPSCAYSGMDENESYIEYAKENFQGDFISGNILSFKKYFKAETFDFFVICGVFHHLPDKVAANFMDSLVNVVDKNTKIIIIDHVKSHELTWFNKLLLKFDRGKFMRDENEYMGLFKDLKIASRDFITVKYFGLIFWHSTIFVLEKR
ncbi:unnamed protein product [marine sediment metagenome]|uniref:Methyltransferase domain-containing protein n=1 Tax=marine sediment metagenome TaxID=412755 RepID=X1C8N5_9ZZZZ